MPISRKRFSFSKNKKSVKKSLKVKKNTRKNKKTTPRRKHKKSGKRFRFFGGNGDEDNCAICTEPLTNGQQIFTTDCINPNATPNSDPYFHHKFHTDCIRNWCSRSQNCKCPLCNAVLNPNPFPPPPNVFPAFANNPIVVEYPNLYRVEFFKFQENPSTGEIEKVKISVHDMTDETIYLLGEYFINQIQGLTPDHLDFFGDPARVNPNGYINLNENNNNVEIPLGDMDVNVGNIDLATIIQTNTHN
jgi:hypothetical protein